MIKKCRLDDIRITEQIFDMIGKPVEALERIETDPAEISACTSMMQRQRLRSIVPMTICIRQYHLLCHVTQKTEI